VLRDYFLGGIGSFLTITRQKRMKKPIVSSRCTYPGASVVNVITAQATIMITAAMIPKSISISLTVSLHARKL